MHQQYADFTEGVLCGPSLDLSPLLNLWLYFDERLMHHGDKTAQIDAINSSTATFSDIHRRAIAVCAWLQQLGLRPGEDTIALQGPNSLYLAPLLIGAWKAGVACALINPASTQCEVENACNITSPCFLITWSPVRAFIQGQEKSGLSEQLAMILQQNHEDFNADDAFLEDQSNHTALVLSSSDSTGLSKGVALSHRNVIAALAFSHEYATSDSIALCVLPLSHAYGLLLMLMSLCEGARLIMLPKFSLAPFLVAARDHQVCTLYLVPSLLALLGRALENDPSMAQSLRWVRLVWTGAGIVCPDLQDRVSTLLPSHPCMCHSYGLAETTFIVLAAKPVRPDKQGSPSKLTRGMECKVVDPATGSTLQVNQVGELLLQGPSVTAGYVENPEATNEAIDKEGWLHTSDLGRYDADSWFYVVDRIKEMIKYHAYQVSPSELEGIIAMIPGVTEVAVIGVPDCVCVELPAALVVLQPDARLEEVEVQQYVASVLLQTTKRWHHICIRTTKNSEWEIIETKGKSTPFIPRNVECMIHIPPENINHDTLQEKNPLLKANIEGVTNVIKPYCYDPEQVGPSCTLSPDNFNDYQRAPPSDQISSSEDSYQNQNDPFYFLFFCYSKYSLACILLVMLTIYAFAALLKPHHYEPLQ